HRIGWTISAVVVLAAGLAGQAQAQQPQAKEKAQAKRTPVPPGVKAERDLDYVGNGLPRQMLDLFVPEDAAGPLPVVVWIHGGAWQPGSKNGCPAMPLTTRG